jgi:hypothetical protein
MHKKEEDWITIQREKEVGGIDKNGQYGKFVVWLEDIVNRIKE